MINTRYELKSSVLRRAFDEGRPGRVYEVQKRLNAAREMPEDHLRILERTAFLHSAQAPGFQARTFH